MTVREQELVKEALAEAEALFDRTGYESVRKIVSALVKALSVQVEEQRQGW